MGFGLFETQVGYCAIAWGDTGILGVQLPEADEAGTRARMQRRFPELHEQTPPPAIEQAIRRIRRTLSGHADDLLDLPLDMSAAPEFHRRVWDATRRIPYGQTRTYGDIARELGDVSAARAVGQALGRNRFAPVVPCHRVLAAQGRMGGFSANGGAHTKRRMLLIEGGLPDPSPGLFDAEESGRIGLLTRIHQRQIDAGVLSVAYEERGDPDGVPVLLMHGFPYDVRVFDEVAKKLAIAGLRVIVPWLRGYGETRFLSPDTLRSGEQAVLGKDLADLLDALQIEQAVLAGFDWGGRAACIVSALWPQRVLGLVTAGGYNIQDIPNSGRPLSPEAEHRLWYQYYLHGERGRAGLAQHRKALCRLLWQQWSPSWRFSDASYEATALAFDNPDFVDVVVHSYRHRFGLVAGDPAVASIEKALHSKPLITVPTVHIDGADDGVTPAAVSRDHSRFFSGRYERRELPGVGHNPAQEAPEAFAAAVLDLL